MKKIAFIIYTLLCITHASAMLEKRGRPQLTVNISAGRAHHPSLPETDSPSTHIRKYVEKLEAAPYNDSTPIKFIVTRAGQTSKDGKSLAREVPFSQLNFAQFRHIPGSQAIYSAIVYKQMDLVEKFKKLCPTPFHQAARLGSIKIIEALHKNGFDINAQSSAGQTALIEAAHCNEFEAVKMLCDLGANLLLANKEGCTALHWAAANNNVEMIMYLHAKGAKMEGRCSGSTVLMIAAAYGALDAAKTLCALGANVKTTGTNAIHEAAYKNNCEMIEFLYQQGVPLNARTRDGKTPLDYARQQKNYQAIALLERLQYNPAIVVKKSRTIVSVAAIAKKSTNPACCTLL